MGFFSRKPTTSYTNTRHAHFIIYNGGYYDGEVDSHNHYHGYGEQHGGDGWIYKGEWKNGRKHGKGLETGPKGQRYSGEFFEGSFIRGEATDERGNRYEGDFPNWCGSCSRFGHLKIIYTDGSVYEGDVYEYMQVRHGKGTMIYPNGDRYVGDWYRFKRQGKGVMYYADGSVYKGKWINDEPAKKS